MRRAVAGFGARHALGAASVLAMVAAALAVAAPGASASGSTITVNTTEAVFTSGDGLCSLAEAIAYANGAPESDCSTAAPLGTTTIDLEPGTYTLGSTIRFTASANLVGAGASSTTLSGAGANEVLFVKSLATVSVSGVTISGGVSGVPTDGCTGTEGELGYSCPAEDGNDGGGVDNEGTLTLSNSVITGNAASAGTAPFSDVVRVDCIIVSCSPAPGQTAGNGGDGGGIYNGTTGILTLDHSTVSGNSAGAGGDGTDGLSGTRGDVSAGQAGGEGGWGGSGAGIYSDGTLTVTDSTISGNFAGNGGIGGAGSSATDASDNGGNGGQGGFGGDGGGIASAGTLTVSGTTLSGNSTGTGSNGGAPGQGSGTGITGTTGAVGFPGAGGAIEAWGGTGSLANTTLADNTSGDTGGGIDDEATPLQLSFVTIAGNTAAEGSGIYEYASTVTEADSIISDNNAASSGNCAQSSGSISDRGGNIVFGDDSCPGAAVDPKLGPLADNGGPTRTMSLTAGSGAIDRVPPASCTATTDQRGVVRPQGGGCDAGAYELAPPVLDSPVAAVNGPQSATVSGQVDPNLTDAKLTVDYGTSTAYGSTATADAGAGNANTPFSLTLSGLEPKTTYHAKVVASNLDGTTSSSDISFTTPVAMTASIPVAMTASIPRSVKGTVIAIKLGCTVGGAGCTGSIKLTSKVTTRGKKVVALAANAKKKRKPKRKTVVRTVATARYSLAAGGTKTVKVTLNAAARKLLTARHRLPAVVALTGAAKLSAKTTFTPVPRRRKHK
jgi:hypothetical protein